MRYLNLTGVLWGILFLSGQCLRAADLTGAFAIGSYHGPTDNTYRQDFENPKEKLGEITGTINSIDRISGDLWVQTAKGGPMEFAIGTNTRLQDHHLEISLGDLRLGDRVTIRFSKDPRLVNSIDRI